MAVDNKLDYIASAADNQLAAVAAVYGSVVASADNHNCNYSYCYNVVRSLDHSSDCFGCSDWKRHCTDSRGYYYRPDCYSDTADIADSCSNYSRSLEIG